MEGKLKCRSYYCILLHFYYKPNIYVSNPTRIILERKFRVYFKPTRQYTRFKRSTPMFPSCTTRLPLPRILTPPQSQSTEKSTIYFTFATRISPPNASSPQHSHHPTLSTPLIPRRPRPAKQPLNSPSPSSSHPPPAEHKSTTQPPASKTASPFHPP